MALANSTDELLFQLACSLYSESGEEPTFEAFVALARRVALARNVEDTDVYATLAWGAMTAFWAPYATASSAAASYGAGAPFAGARSADPRAQFTQGMGGVDGARQPPGAIAAYSRGLHRQLFHLARQYVPSEVATLPSRLAGCTHSQLMDCLTLMEEAVVRYNGGSMAHVLEAAGVPALTTSAQAASSSTRHGAAGSVGAERGTSTATQQDLWEVVLSRSSLLERENEELRRQLLQLHYSAAPGVGNAGVTTRQRLENLAGSVASVVRTHDVLARCSTAPGADLASVAANLLPHASSAHEIGASFAALPVGGASAGFGAPSFLPAHVALSIAEAAHVVEDLQQQVYHMLGIFHAAKQQQTGSSVAGEHGVDGPRGAVLASGDGRSRQQDAASPVHAPASSKPSRHVAFDIEAHSQVLEERAVTLGRHLAAAESSLKHSMQGEISLQREIAQLRQALREKDSELQGVRLMFAENPTLVSLITSRGGAVPAAKGNSPVQGDVRPPLPRSGSLKDIHGGAAQGITAFLLPTSGPSYDHTGTQTEEDPRNAIIARLHSDRQVLLQRLAAATAELSPVRQIRRELDDAESRSPSM